jgi:Lrp/AsnC family transcriptional regulator for asnA, asnC and gidA
MPMDHNPRSSSLDELDFAILSHLREDGRKSFTDLANTLQVSVSTIRKRYTRLVEDNILRVYGRVNSEKVGKILYAQILIMVRPSKFIEPILSEIAGYPEVSFLAVATGDYDIEADAMCRNNDHLNQLVYDKIIKIEGVDFVRTNIYLRILKIAQPDLSQLFLSKEQNKI